MTALAVVAIVAVGWSTIVAALAYRWGTIDERRRARRVERERVQALARVSEPPPTFIAWPPRR